MTPAQIQTLIDACRTSPADLVTWLELKAVLEGLKNQDLGLTLTTTGTSGPATLDIDTDILNIPNYSTDLTVYVPYTGANQNVNLGEYGIRSGWYQFDLTPTGTPVSASTMYWDDNQKTVALVMGGTTQEIGHDQFYHAKNSTGTTIPKGTAVRFAGTDGSSGHLLITPFLADGSNPSSYFMGVTAESITNGSFGKVQSFGRLDGIDTSAFAEGDILYASTTVAGGFQTTVPVAPNNIVQVAAVVSDAVNGKLLIRPTLGSKLTSDESVKLTSLANGNVLQYNSTLAVWENVAPSTLAVNNIYSANGTLTGNRTVTMGNNTLTFTGSGSNRVGIGITPTSGYMLDVGGNLRIDVGYGIYFNNQNVGLKRDANFLDLGGFDGVRFFSSATTLPSQTERMRIFSNGNIGINTTTDAGFRLDVNGTMRVQGNTTVNGIINLTSPAITNTRESLFVAKVSDNATDVFGIANATSGNTRFAGCLYYYSENSSNALVFRGLTSSAADTGTTPLVLFQTFRSSSSSDPNNGTFSAISTRPLFSFQNNDVAYLQISSDGNVGIGTTSPTYKLHVVGTGRITGNVELSVDSGAYTIIGAAGDTTYRLSVDGDLRVYGNIRTAQPTGGTATGVWRLGSAANGTFTLNIGTCVEIEIGGTLYKLATVS